MYPEDRASHSVVKPHPTRKSGQSTLLTRYAVAVEFGIDSLLPVIAITTLERIIVTSVSSGHSPDLAPAMRKGL